MTNINEGVGKKIVEALKKQTELDVEDKVVQTEDLSLQSDDSIDVLNTVAEDVLSSEVVNDDSSDALGMNDFFNERIELETESVPDYTDFSDRDEKPGEAVDMPSNILVLKKLVTQLPSGVTRHTGAQIIRQTMEALGISMKSVLTEAQEVQNNLKESSKECQMTIQEYKRKISNLEKQTQNYQKQYVALNDLISLFIQTSK